MNPAQSLTLHMNPRGRIRVAIIGTGNIGTDLLFKLLRCPELEFVAFVGRRPNTKSLPPEVLYSDQSINFFIDNPNSCDVVFDCTDAATALKNAAVFLEHGIVTIDLTPSKVGRLCVPRVNSECLRHAMNVNMVTCGGQTSIPLLKYLTSKCTPSYTEVVTQIASDSAGFATRLNVDSYIHTTEYAIEQLVGIENCKVILNVNPSSETVMQTTIYMKVLPGACFEDFDNFIQDMQGYVSEYISTIKPTYIADNILIVSVKVLGAGDYLSKNAGNLDIINCAAVEVCRILFGYRNEETFEVNEYNKKLDI